MSQKLRLKSRTEKKNRLNRKKSDPNRFYYTGKQENLPQTVQLFSYNSDFVEIKQDLQLIDLPSVVNANQIDWVNVFGLNQIDEIASFCEKQGIHSLVIQDILDVNQRPKFQEYEQFSFVTLKSISVSEEITSYDHISFVFSENYLISFQEKKANLFEHIRFRLKENTGILRERKTDILLYVMIESILDNYFKTLDLIEHGIEELNLFDASKDPSPELLISIENLKKTTNYIQKSILPIKKYTLHVERGDAQFIEQRHIKYYQELKDLCLSLIDQCEMIQDSLESATNLFFSLQGNRMNQVIKILTIVSTIFIPLTFIVGIYGMNFTNMPELEWRYGYLLIMLLNLAIFGGMLLYFKKKKWF